MATLPSSATTMAFERNRNFSTLWIVIGLFATIIGLELVTPADYVFSYLYIGPILLANLRLDRNLAFQLTLLAILMTLVNLWLPGSHIVTVPTIANRFIAVLAMLITAMLSYRNRYYEETIAQHQAKLQYQEKLTSLREDFVSTLSHDLKTPLLGAIETLKAFQQDRFGEVTMLQQQVLATMVRSHQASLQLVEMVLDVYRNDTEGVRLERSPMNLVEMAEQVVKMLHEMATSYQVSIHLRYESRLDQQWVNGDMLQLQRVLSNLLINAIHHSPIDGVIEIDLATLHPLGQQRILVIDQGPGIHPEELPQLFERFYQGHSDRQAKGSGLGLYLSRQIVEAHGGKIWAENHVPRGACFGFWLPALTQ